MNNQEKNQLIIQEILKWKENRLLPEEQCDFLLALYTKGGEIEIPNQSDLRKQDVSLSIWKKNPFCFYFIHFSKRYLFGLLFPFILVYYVWYFECYVNYKLFLLFKKNRANISKRYRYLFIFIQFLYILQLSVFIADAAGLGNYINFAIILNGCGWIIFGYLKKLPVFKYVGAILIIAVITYVVFFKYIG